MQWFVVDLTPFIFANCSFVLTGDLASWTLEKLAMIILIKTFNLKTTFSKPRFPLGRCSGKTYRKLSLIIPYATTLSCCNKYKESYHQHSVPQFNSLMKPKIWPIIKRFNRLNGEISENGDYLDALLYGVIMRG